MSPRPDLLPVGRLGFGTEATDSTDTGGAWRAYAYVVVALVVLTVGLLGFLWWLDRVAEPPSFRPTIQPRASVSQPQAPWLNGPIRAEQDFASLTVYGSDKP